MAENELRELYHHPFQPAEPEAHLASRLASKIFELLPCKPTDLLSRLTAIGFIEHEIKDKLAKLLVPDGPIELTGNRILQRRQPALQESQKDLSINCVWDDGEIVHKFPCPEAALSHQHEPYVKELVKENGHSQCAAYKL